MNFDSFREKLKASAAQAALAAQQFEGFDAMAAKDDYIHSEEFNVASNNRQRKEAAQQQQQQQEQYEQQRIREQLVDHDHDDTSTLSTHSSLKRVPSKSNSSNQAQPAANQKDYNRAHSLQDVVPLKVSVPDRQLSLPAQNVDSPTSSYHDDDYDNASNSSEEDDPIMSLIRKQKGAQNKKTKAGSSSPVRKLSESLHLQETPKQKHRFMEDLDSRLAMENEDLQPLMLSPARAASPAAVSTEETPQSWFSNVAAKSLDFIGQRTTLQQSSLSSSPAPLLARTKQRRNHQHDDELANVAVVSSTAMLGDEEMRELEQMRAQQQQSFSLVTLLWNLVKNHPREGFIVFTLLLGSYLYFRSSGGAGR